MRTRRTQLLAALLLLLGVLAPLGGCGSGSPSPDPTSSGSPSPTPSDDIPRPTRDFQPGYFDSLFAGRRTQRWPDNRSELLVFLSGEPGGRSADEAARILLDGADQWKKVLDGRMRFRRVSSADIADITVSFVPGDTLGDGLLGLTTVTIQEASDSGVDAISAARIELKIGQSDALLTMTAAHEFGHALGITGNRTGLPSHSPDPADLMAEVVRTTSKLTQRDANVMGKLYSLPRPPLRSRPGQAVRVVRSHP